MDEQDQFVPPPLVPRRAPVTPRVRLEPPVTLERLVRDLVAKGKPVRVNLNGPPGSGKTTALQHLAAVLPADAPVRLYDAPPPKLILNPSYCIDIYASDVATAKALFLTLEMAPWTDDDLIEYMLAVHPGRCRAVLPRVLADPTRAGLNGSPTLWRAVLDQMAADDNVVDIDTALWMHLAWELADPARRSAAQSLSLHGLVWTAELPASTSSLEPRLLAILSSPRAQTLLAAERLVEDLIAGTGNSNLEPVLPRELVERAGRLCGDMPEAVRRLRELADAPGTQAMATSLLNVAGLAPQPA